MKLTKILMGAVCVSIPLGMQAQISKQMKYIPAGTFTMGGGYQYEVRGSGIHCIESNVKDTTRDRAIGDPIPYNNPERIVSAASFYLSEQEVTNEEYRTFLRDSILDDDADADFTRRLKQAAKKGEQEVAKVWSLVFSLANEKHLLPDTSCWVKDFPYAFNGPLVRFYFSHPAFNDYPVVGVNWDQANAYCSWLTNRNNVARAKKGLPAQPAYRLPTEAEWEYAARGVTPDMVEGDDYPQPGYYQVGEGWLKATGKWTANVKTGYGDYIDDGYEYTAPVKIFPPNEFGLYDMPGNVAEWTQDVFIINRGQSYSSESDEPDSVGFNRVVKGGSWADYEQAAFPGSRTSQLKETGAARTGFRIAMTVSGGEM